MGALVGLALLSLVDLPACKASALTGDTYNLSVWLTIGQAFNTPVVNPVDGGTIDRDLALKALNDTVAACDAGMDLIDDSAALGSQAAVAIDEDQVLLKNLAAVKDELPPDLSLIVSQVLGPSGDGVPVPKKFALAVAQVVSAGQPGFSASGAGAFRPTSGEEWERHVGGSLSALVIQPVVQPATGGTAFQFTPPRFTSFEATVGWDNRITPYDVLTIPPLERLKAEQEAAFYSAHSFLREFRDRKQASASDQAAIEAATAEAIRIFHLSIQRFLRKQFKEKLRPRVQSRLGGRVRVSPDPSFAPDLPDLFSVVVDGAIDSPMLNIGDWGLTGSLRAVVGLSAAPNALVIPGGCTSLDCDWRPSVYAEVVGSARVLLPIQGVGRASVKADGFFRSIPLRNTQETSFGFSASFIVPVSADMSLMATYSQRWFLGQGNVSTAGVSFTKALLD